MKRLADARWILFSRKLLAVATTFVAIVLLYLYLVPAPTGADAEETSAQVERILAAAANPDPEPVRTASLPSPGQEAARAGDDIEDADLRPAGEPANVQSTRTALLVNLLLLEKGAERLSQISDYTATFFKQERIGLSLDESQIVIMKLRHEPFSVYMHWLKGDKDRELLYVEGQNDGNMIVHPGGWKARLLPALKLDPTGSLAMRESRHPVTMVGLLNLANRLAQNRRDDLKELSGVTCRMVEDQEINGRRCYCFVLEYASPAVSQEYRKSVQYIDQEYLLPVTIKNYGWLPPDESVAPEALDENTLVEHYAYYDLQLNQQLADADFDHNNSDYRFRR